MDIVFVIVLDYRERTVLTATKEVEFLIESSLEIHHNSLFNFKVMCRCAYSIFALSAAISVNNTLAGKTINV